MNDRNHTAIADELEAAGWPAVAEDVREGVPLETVLSRLAEIGEAESEAAEIIAFPAS